MPLTFDARVQRSLATHTPAESLVAAARPLSHEIRTDGPMGVVSQLMRVVDEPTALAAASMTSGPDLVLRTRRMSSVELDADASLGTLAPSFSPSRAASASAASTPAALGEAAPGTGPIARAADEVIGASVTDAEDEPSDRDAEPSDRQTTPRATPLLAPTLAGAPALTGAVHRWTATDVATPLRSLQTAVASPAEEGRVPSRAGFASLTLAPPIPSAEAPTLNRPDGPGRTAPVARSADLSTSTSPTPLVGRRRHVVEVKSAAEPVDPTGFRAVDPPHPVDSDPSKALRSEGLRSDASTREAGAGSVDDVTGPTSTSSPISRAADGEASADPQVVVAEQGPVARPTLGRRPGLGMPMNALPASAIGVQRESDPFAGWNDDDDPLPLADRGATPPGPESATAVSGTTASSSAASGPAASNALTVRRAADTQPASIGSAVDLLASASAEPAAAAAPQPAGDTAFDADAAGPHGDTATGVLLQPITASAPTLGMQQMQRVVDDRSSVSVIGGPGPVTTTVPVQWLVGAARVAPSGPGSGRGAPAVDRVAGVEGVANQGIRSSAGSGGGGSIGGSGAGGSTVSRSPASGNPDAPSLGSSAVAAALAGPPSSEVESATPAGDDGLSVIRRLPSAPLPSTDVSGSADAYRSGAGNGSWGDDWGGTFPGAVVPAERLTGFDEGSTPSFGDPSFRDQARASSPGALRTLSRMPGEATPMSLPVVPLTRFPADSNAIERAAGSGSGSGSASVSGGGPLPVAPIGTSTTIARRAEGMAAGAVPAAGGAGSSGGGSGSARVSGEDGAAEPFAQYDVESSLVFREADDGGAAASTAATPAAAGEGGATAGAAAQADSDMDKLAATLYERLRQRLRRELLDDRERAGFALDRVR